VTTAQIRRELANSHLDADARRIWTEALAQPEFAKVEVIWAWGAGPDHNNGRCCDFMVTIAGVPRPEQVRIGDAIRAYFKRHAKRLHVTGIIWNRKVTGFPSQSSHYRGPEGQERPYSGPSTHTDHCHIEVTGKAPLSWLEVPVPGLPSTRIVYVDRLHTGQKDSDSVRWVQYMLGVPVTGTYDEVTVAAAKAFQRSLGDDALDGQLGKLQTAALVAKHHDLGLSVEDKA
jgi:peptidoglycan hydrolase-like protein with peptidoglycan-binding domain